MGSWVNCAGGERKRLKRQMARKALGVNDLKDIVSNQMSASPNILNQRNEEFHAKLVISQVYQYIYICIYNFSKTQTVELIALIYTIS